MPTFPTEQFVHTLLNEVAEAASDLKRSVAAEIVLAVHRTNETLGAPATTQANLALMLSAARRHVQAMEKRVVALIIGAEPFSQREMSRLVRIRLICTKLLNTFALALADLRLHLHGNKLRLPSHTAS